MNAWLSLSSPVQMAMIAAYGLAVAVLVNHVIYTYCYFPRPISPWTTRDPKLDEMGVAPRGWLDRFPIFGWLRLRRETAVHGTGHWIRPLLIELLLPIGLMGLFWFECGSGGLLTEGLRTDQVIQATRPILTPVFFAHALLVPLMVAATFIDFDEQTIPDVITVPGTWIALIFAAATSRMFMPTMLPVFGPFTGLQPTTFESPWFNPIAGFLNGLPSVRVGLFIWAGWCFAMLDRRFPMVVVRRRGIQRAIRFFFDGIFAHSGWMIVAAMWVIGSGLIIAAYLAGGDTWYGLLSSLIGLAAGGGLVWAIRIVASLSMGVEAMGFGDVTFMAMIGAFVGWQASIAAFFLAPFTAIGIVLIQFVLTRNRYTPFGPYLAAGTLVTILAWPLVYAGNLAQYLKMIGPVFIWIAVALLGLMAVLLMAMRAIRGFLYRG